MIVYWSFACMKQPSKVGYPCHISSCTMAPIQGKHIMFNSHLNEFQFNKQQFTVDTQFLCKVPSHCTKSHQPVGRKVRYKLKQVNQKWFHNSILNWAKTTTAVWELFQIFVWFCCNSLLWPFWKFNQLFFVFFQTEKPCLGIVERNPNQCFKNPMPGLPDLSMYLFKWMSKTWRLCMFSYWGRALQGMNQV